MFVAGFPAAKSPRNLSLVKYLEEQIEMLFVCPFALLVATLSLTAIPVAVLNR